MTAASLQDQELAARHKGVLQQLDEGLQCNQQFMLFAISVLFPLQPEPEQDETPDFDQTSAFITQLYKEKLDLQQLISKPVFMQAQLFSLLLLPIGCSVSGLSVLCLSVLFARCAGHACPRGCRLILESTNPQVSSQKQSS